MKGMALTFNITYMCFFSFLLYLTVKIHTFKHLSMHTYIGDSSDHWKSKGKSPKKIIFETYNILAGHVQPSGELEVYLVNIFLGGQ